MYGKCLHLNSSLGSCVSLHSLKKALSDMSATNRMALSADAGLSSHLSSYKTFVLLFARHFWLLRFNTGYPCKETLVKAILSPLSLADSWFSKALC